MNFNKKLAVAVSGAVLLMAGQIALADSTTDIVDALVSKGVLTEEEGKLITKGAQSKAKADEKAIKGKLSISNVLESATLYGNYRARYEYRQGENATTEIERQRPRGKVELGVETKGKNAYSDIALTLGAAGRSDNFSVGSDNVTADTAQNKMTVTLKRAMFGYNVTPWLTIDAGIMKNPLYTTPMVWDADLSVGGFAEKFKYKTDGGTELFANLVQHFYGPGYRTLTTTKATGVTVGTHDSTIFANQIGANIPLIADKATAKVAATYYVYGGGYGSKGTTTLKYAPGIPSGAISTTFANGNNGMNSAVNDLDVLEIPAEINYMVNSNHGLRVMGSYVYNFSGDDRATQAGLVDTANAAVYSANVDDTSWMLGIAYGSAKDLKAFEGNKFSEGDWRISAAYQSMGAFAQDQNLNDSDIFDSRLNTKGWVLRGQYNVDDNLAVNLVYADAERKNGALATVTSSGNDLGINWNDFKLFQADVTYKF
jgi:polyhydroxyalkanoate synthesis regulator phasin